MTELKLRPATQADATTLKRVFELASHGLSTYLWNAARKEGENLDHVALCRMRDKIADPDQSITVAEIDGCPAGGLLSYAITETESLIDQPAMMRSFIEVDNALIGTRYVNALAVFPEFRRKGVATALLDQERAASAKNGMALSLSVCDENPHAVATYHRNGFTVVGSTPMEKEDWDGVGNTWILMVNERDHSWSPPWPAGSDTSRDLQPPSAVLS